MTKKNYFLGVMAAGMVLFTACSKDEGIIDNGSPVADTTAQELVLQIASSGDGLTTKAGRPLYAADAAQQIDFVKVIIYDAAEGANSAIKYARLIDKWMGDEAVSTPYADGRQYTLSLKGTDKLEQGTYKVVAVGYSDNTGYGKFSPDLTTLVKDGTSATYSTISGTIAGDAEEVFAGEADLTVDEKGQFTFTAGESGVVVPLHRQVAGGFGYFTKIPASVDGTDAASLRLVTRTKNTKVKFTDFNSGFTTTGTGAKYIVNGDTPAAFDAKFNGSADNDGNVLYTIALSDWFDNGENGKLDANEDGFLTYSATAGEGDKWKHATGVNTAVVKGSVFAGKFMIPFSLTTGANTMELQLLAADGSILKTWGVKIPAGDVATGKNDPEKSDESASIFNVVRNHMYNLGVKTEHTPNIPGTTEPDPDPENPTPGTDNPEDLSKGQDLILKVNANWEVIHKLELD